jgi:hypothetical protein
MTEVDKGKQAKVSTEAKEEEDYKATSQGANAPSN